MGRGNSASRSKISRSALGTDGWGETPFRRRAGAPGHRDRGRRSPEGRRGLAGASVPQALREVWERDEKGLDQRRGRPCAQATVVDAFARAEVRSGGTPEPAGGMPTLPEIRPRPSGVCLFPKGGMRGSRAFRCGDPRRGKIGFLRIPSRCADGNEDPEFLSSPETKSGVPPEEGTPD